MIRNCLQAFQCVKMILCLNISFVRWDSRCLRLSESQLQLIETEKQNIPLLNFFFFFHTSKAKLDFILILTSPQITPYNKPNTLVSKNKYCRREKWHSHIDIYKPLQPHPHQPTLLYTTIRNKDFCLNYVRNCSQSISLEFISVLSAVRKFSI